ncbi:uncharacterized protein FOMMEDRAFT_100091, partial [Fomitiporia mediterranea MF3/22]
AEFAYNNKQHSATKHTPFYLIYGRHPNITFNYRKSNVEEANKYLKEIKIVQANAKEAIEKSQEQMKKYTDKHRGNLPELKEGDFVLLDSKNLNLAVPTRKLANRYIEPFEIEKQIGVVNYKLKLLEGMNIHPVFYSGLLIPYKEKEYPGRQVYTNLDPELINKE